MVLKHARSEKNETGRIRAFMRPLLRVEPTPGIRSPEVQVPRFADLGRFMSSDVRN
jgi:hypothetical protein